MKTKNFYLKPHKSSRLKKIIITTATLLYAVFAVSVLNSASFANYFFKVLGFGNLISLSPDSINVSGATCREIETKTKLWVPGMRQRI